MMQVFNPYLYLRMADAFQDFDVVRIDDQGASPAIDRVASELPLEVRLEGQPFSVIMRTLVPMATWPQDSSLAKA